MAKQQTQQTEQAAEGPTLAQIQTVWLNRMRHIQQTADLMEGTPDVSVSLQATAATYKQCAMDIAPLLERKPAPPKRRGRPSKAAPEQPEG